MGKDAPDERAQKLADLISGKAAPESEVASLIAGAVSVGQRGEDGKPIGDKVTAEEFRSGKKPAAKASDEEDDEEENVETPEDEGDDQEEDDTDGDALDTEEEEGDEESDDDEEDDGTEHESVDYNDEDTLEVKVDGTNVEVSLRELKRVFSLHEATEKRLKEATEERTAAHAERELVQTEIQEHRTNLLRTIQQLDGVLFAPLVDKPSPKLRAKNMQEYLMQNDAFEEDQARIAAGREELKTFLADEQQSVLKQRKEFRDAQFALLADKMPELKDPEKGVKVQKDIMDAAAHYGFTPQMVAQVDDHRLFLMARDASRWLNMQKIKSSGKIPTDGDTTNKIKRRKGHLKAGNGTSATGTKLALVKTQREQRAAVIQAQKTGSVNDVANMLLSKTRKRVKPDDRTRRNV